MRIVSALLLATWGTDSLDRELAALMEKHHVPGMQIALLRDLKLVRYGNYGYSDLALKRRVNDETTFEIASISKVVTGLAVRMLLNGGKLRLEDRVTAFLPLASRWRELEIRHLLGMSMGIGDDWDLYPWGDIRRGFDDASTLRFFDGMEPKFPIGERFEYCSPAYAMLGMIVEKVTGLRIGEFLRKRVFAPAGMKRTSVLGNGRPNSGKAVGYRFEDGQIKPGFSISNYLHGRADVGVLTTAKDLVKFMVALDGQRLVAKPDALWTAFPVGKPGPRGYGYGWYVDSANGIPYHYHGGLFRTGFRSMLMCFPTHRVTVIVVTNNYATPVREFIRTLTRHLEPGIVVPD